VQGGSGNVVDSGIDHSDTYLAVGAVDKDSNDESGIDNDTHAERCNTRVRNFDLAFAHQCWLLHHGPGQPFPGVDKAPF